MSNIKHVWKRVGKLFSILRLYQNWPTALLDRSRILPPQQMILYKLRNKTSLMLQAHSGDYTTVNDIWIEQVYTPDSAWQIGGDWVVVDLGAHKGIFSTFAANAKKIIAVEANPATYAIYRENIARNGLQKKVQSFHGIIANEDGESTLYIAHDSGACSSILYDSLSVRQQVTVPKISIYRIFKHLKHVDLLKMDIEGSEFELFQSPECHLWLEKVQRLSMEYHSRFPGIAHTVAELIKPLKNMGFRVHLRKDKWILWAEKIDT